MQIELQSTRRKTLTSWNGSWSNGLPDSYTDVVLTAVYNTGVNGSFSCNNLTINANLTISADTGIKVLGPLVTQSPSVTFNVANKGEFILLHPSVDVSTVKITANFTPQSLLTRLDYWFLSSPISGIPVLNISPTTLSTRFYEYGYTVNNEVPFEGYSVIDPAVAATVIGKGYLIRTPSTFPGTPSSWNITANNLSAGTLNKGIILHTPSFVNDITVGGGYYYLTGNPYLGSLDLRKFIERNSGKINDIIHIWYKTNNTDRESYIQINPVESRSAAFSTTMRPFQAFIVQYKNPDETDRTLIFSPDMQVLGKNFEHNYFNLNYKQNSVNIPVGSCTYNADAFEENFSDYRSTISLLTFFQDGLKLILHRGVEAHEGQIIDMYYQAVATENFTISLTGFGGSFNEFKILLIDNQLNISTNLKESSYTFAGVLGESSTERFKIKITNF